MVLREITERLEAVEAGTVKLVDTDKKAMLCETTWLVDDHVEYVRMVQAAKPYGDGHASERIVSALNAACS